VEGTVFESAGPRLVRVDEVEVEAPLEGRLLLVENEDQPGVIGEVGTILGRHRINIGSFALGRARAGAVGIVTLDTETDVPEPVLTEIRAVPAIKEVWEIQA
jgi:D-3-phosphoglycerate dehydrogenase